jgi:hypothetical protein
VNTSHETVSQFSVIVEDVASFADAPLEGKDALARKDEDLGRRPTAEARSPLLLVLFMF